MLKPHLMLAALACVLLANVGSTHAARPGIQHQQVRHDQEMMHSEHAAGGASLAALTNPFHCIGNKNEADCDAYESECTWCNSTTVGTGCYPLKIAKILPAKYFNCDYDPNDEASSEGSEGEHTEVAAELQKKKHKKDDEDDDDISPIDCFSQKKKACKKADACEWCVSDTGMGSCFAADVAQYIPFCNKPGLSSALSESSASSDSSDEDEGKDVSDSSASSSDSSDEDEDEDEDEDSSDEDEDESGSSSSSSDDEDEEDEDEGKKHHKVDCVSKNTSAACDEEESCNWCSTSGLGTGCYPKKVSDYLPESVFKCDKPSDACVKQGTKKDCISEDGCSWCTTGGLGTGCYPEKVADRLPKRFFTCEDGDDDDEDDSGSSSESSASESSASESSSSEGSSSSESSGSESSSSSESSGSESSASESSGSESSSSSESSGSESSASESSGSEGSSSSESSGSESSASESSGSEGSSSSESSGSEREHDKKPSFIDCMNKDTALECDASDRCSWCVSSGLGTGCYPRKVSKILPHKVFDCDKEPLKDEEQEEQKLGDAKCEKKSENECVAPSCVWCTSAAVGSACYSPDEAARLPSAVFSCKTAPSFAMPIA